MNQLIDTHGKAIITGLLVVIAVLAIMLFESCSTGYHTGFQGF